MKTYNIVVEELAEILPALTTEDAIIVIDFVASLYNTHPRFIQQDLDALGVVDA